MQVVSGPTASPPPPHEVVFDGTPEGTLTVGCSPAIPGAASLPLLEPEPELDEPPAFDAELAGRVITR